MTIPYAIKTEELASAAAWRLASLLLERPTPEWKDKIAALCCEITDEKLLACAAQAGPVGEEIYHRLFGPGGTLSPREVSYCGFEDPGRLMAELQAFYQAFSFNPQREESIDHLSVEAGFVGYLFLKEAYARMDGNPEAANLTKSARERFAEEHIARCVAGMTEPRSDKPGYLQLLLSWLMDRLERDRRPLDRSATAEEPA